MGTAGSTKVYWEVSADDDWEYPTYNGVNGYRTGANATELHIAAEGEWWFSFEFVHLKDYDVMFD